MIGITSSPVIVQCTSILAFVWRSAHCGKYKSYSHPAYRDDEFRTCVRKSINSRKFCQERFIKGLHHRETDWKRNHNLIDLSLRRDSLERVWSYPDELSSHRFARSFPTRQPPSQSHHGYPIALHVLGLGGIILNSKGERSYERNIFANSDLNNGMCGIYHIEYCCKVEFKRTESQHKSSKWKGWGN